MNEEDKLRPDDQGGILMAVHVERGHVVIEFPKPVMWLGLPPELAIKLAEDLIRNAQHAGYPHIVEMHITPKTLNGSRH